ncbi:MAG: hypothetical protein D8M57_05270 [Candidatus Scalindua sp. AMX11]|nr:MAG: hypothetical protein DWQ00_07515 [Candidatus Scalindua sp.]TDE65951.1 MAG: hypothetical protein D8M57_05270 [Candidatus Scalindua sp. AMX11]
MLNTPIHHLYSFNRKSKFQVNSGPEISKTIIVYSGGKNLPVSEKITVYPISKAIKLLVGLTKLKK